MTDVLLRLAKPTSKSFSCLSILSLDQFDAVPISADVGFDVDSPRC